MSKNVKNTTLPNLFSLLAPYACRGCGRLGDPLCQRCKNNIILQHQNFCPVCHSLNPDGKCPKCQKLPPIFIVDYKDSLVGNLVHAFKYESIRALSSPLAEILNGIIPQPKFKESNYITVPLPTASHHIRERGLDHTTLIAKRLAKIRPQTKVQKLLARKNNTVQVGSDRQTRFTQASSAYTLNPKINIKTDSTYILLDDVWTTGASLQSAYSLLQKAGAQKIVIAVLIYGGPRGISELNSQNGQ